MPGDVMWALVGKELRQLSQHWLCFALRVVPAAVVLAHCFAQEQPATIHGYQRFVREVYKAVGAVEFVALGVLLFWVAPALTQERERGTLPLLLLTSFSPATIALAKAASRMALLGVPALTMTGVVFLLTLLGGLEPAQFLRLQAAYVVTGLFTVSFAVAISARSRTTVSAVTMLVAWSLLLWMLVPAAVLSVTEALIRQPDYQLYLMPLHLPALVSIVLDPLGYASVISAGTWWLLPAGFALHLLAAAGLLGCAGRWVANRELLWRPPERPVVSGQRWWTRAYWKRVGLPLRRWLRGRLAAVADLVERAGVPGVLTLRAVVGNPYDSRGSLGMFVLAITALPMGALLLSEAEPPWDLVALALILAVPALLVLPAAPGVACAMLGVALGLQPQDVFHEITEDVLATAVVVAAPVLWATAAAGLVRDRTSAMLEVLNATPLSATTLTAIPVACAARAAVPVLALVAGALATHLAVVLQPELSGGGHERADDVWFTTANLAMWWFETLLDLIMGLVVAVAFGLVAKRTGGAVSMVAGAYALTWLMLIAADQSPFLRPVYVFPSVGLVCLVVGSLLRNRTWHVWLSGTGLLWFLGAAPALAVELMPRLHTQSLASPAWWRWWMLYPLNVFRQIAPLGQSATVLFLHAVVACILLAWLCANYEAWTGRPAGATAPRPAGH